MGQLLSPGRAVTAAVMPLGGAPPPARGVGKEKKRVLHKQDYLVLATVIKSLFLLSHKEYFLGYSH